MSLIIQIIQSRFTKFGVIQFHRKPEFGACENFYSRRECKLVNQSRFIKSHLKLIKSNSRRLLSDLSPNPIPRTSIYVRLFYLGPYSPTGYSVRCPLINSYPTRLHTSTFDPDLKKSTSARILNVAICLFQSKIRKLVVY
jgi:hypothetical protein